VAYTTTDFLSSVRQRGSIPTSSSSSNVNNTTNLLAFATEELHIKLLPMILAAREEFYVRNKDHTIAANTSRYAIPTRAAGMMLRDVQMIVGTSIRSLPPVDSEQISTTAVGEPIGYYLEDSNVVLYPTPGSATGTLRLRYYLRPSKLVATTACAQISAIDTGTGVITVGSLPSTITTSTAIDLVSANSPFRTMALDLTPSATSSTTVTVAAADLPTGLAVGDWVALADTSPIPQVPYEFLPVLSHLTVARAMEAIGDEKGAAMARKELELLAQNATTLVSPRVHGEPKRIVARRWASR